jgi:hypothetical protein
MEYFRPPASRWIYDTAIAAVTGTASPPFIGKRCQIGMVKPASKVVTVSDVQVGLVWFLSMFSWCHLDRL